MFVVKEIWTISEYNYQKELLRKFSFGGNKEEMNSWINQKTCRQKWQLQVGSRQGGTSQGKLGKKPCCWVPHQNVSWLPNIKDSRRVRRVSKGNSV